MNNTHDTIDYLWKILQDRKENAPSDSYVARLYAKGVDKIAQKVGEEATETVIEAVRTARDEKGAKALLLEESADLFFHLLVLWSSLDVTPDDVLDVLQSRINAGGHKDEVV